MMPSNTNQNMKTQKQHDQDGGPAFPRSDSTYAQAQSGMTLRDWFAGQALQAIPSIGCGSDLHFNEIAIEAYRLADAMLAERNKHLNEA